MKPFLSLIASMPICLALFACGGSGDNSQDNSNNNNAGSEIVAPNVTPTPSPASETTPKPSAEPTTSYRLDWVAPQQRVDGTPLLNKEITGYVLRWTNTTTAQSQQVELEANINRWDLDLPAAQYRFEIASKDHQGRLSQFVSAQ
ncbi:hypothetical protein K6Y31_01180 [Motilimonas cestriensis]|uniref:Fibronectin type-III domain-containing protein n=1 Tax=Motilimonas cestriensis TaxID=2742685 RepID=A0ABS8W6Q1_9GAMM|nr:hypothetical protein [Motilimonas cestriensis]MCE2593433.1 hypothetical protein [Motilimonas cestriensis]